jgi:hypothetical protein
MTCHIEGGGVAHVLLQRVAAPRTGWTVEGDAAVHDSVASVLKSQRSIRFPPTDAVKKAFELKWSRTAPPTTPAALYAEANQLPALKQTSSAPLAVAQYSEPSLRDGDDGMVRYDDVDAIAGCRSVVVNDAPIVVRAPLGSFTLKRGDLVLGDVLGQGAFGFVKKATLGEQQVAVKQVLVSGDLSAAQRQKAVSDFENEAKRMAAVPQHRNIVQMIGALELDSGELVLITELCNGGSLVSKLYGDSVVCKFEPDELLAVAHDCAAGLAHLHFHSCVHRDVAARNVLLYNVRGGAWVGKIADFGMARELGRDSVDEKVTKTRTVPVRWMAPETVSAERQIIYSFKTDVFAFGALLFEMFAQRQPYNDVKRNDAVMLMIARSEPLLLPADSAVAAPAGIADVLAQCRETEPENRPTMRTVGATIAQLIIVK